MDRDLPEKRVTRASSKRAAASCSQNLAPPGGDVGPNLASPTDMRNNSERVERSCSNKYGRNVFFLDGKQRVVEFTVSTTVGDVLNGVASTVSVEKFPTLALYLQRYRAPDARDALSTSDYVRIDEKTLMADVVTDVAGVRQRSNGRVRARLLFHQKFSGVTDGTMTDFVFLYLTYTHMEQLRQQAFVGRDELMGVVQQTWKVEERLQAAVKEKEALLERSKEETARVQSELKALQESTAAERSALEAKVRQEEELRKTETQVAASERQAWEARLGDLEHAKAEEVEQLQRRAGAEMRGQADALEQSQQVVAQLQEQVRQSEGLLERSSEQTSEARSAVERSAAESRRLAEALKQSQLVVAQLDAQLKMKDAHLEQQTRAWEQERSEAAAEIARAVSRALVEKVGDVEAQHGALESALAAKEAVWADDRRAFLESIERLQRQEVEAKHLQGQAEAGQEQALQERSRVQSEMEEVRRQVEEREKAEAGLQEALKEKEQQLERSVEEASRVRSEVERLQQQASASGNYLMEVVQQSWEVEERLQAAVREKEVLQNRSQEDTARAQSERQGLRQHADALTTRVEESRRVEAQLRQELANEKQLRGGAEEREAQLKGAVEKEAVLRREAEERETQLKGAVEKEMVLRREAEERETTLQEELSGKEVQLRSEVEGKAVLLAAASAAQRELEELREKLSKLQREALERTRAAEEAGQKWEVKRLEVELENVRKLDEVQKELSNTRRELSNARGEALEQAGAAGKEKEALLEELWGLRLKMKSKELAVAKETAEARAAEGMAAGAVVASLERAVKEAERLEVELKASKSLAAQYKADKEELERVLQQERASAAKAEELRGQLREATCSAEALATRGMAEATLREELEEKEADLQKFRKQVEELRASEKRLDVKVKDLEKQYNEEVSKRRKLQDSMGSIRGIVRCRPLSAEEESTGHMPVVTCSDKFTVEHSGKDGELNSHPFYRVYDPTATQANVFESVEDLVEASLDGFNACILAYGQTGSGKTYTMCGNEAQPGLIPLAVRKIFNSRDKSPAHVTIEVQVCMLELYLKDVLDLLDPKDPKNPAGISVTGKRQVNLKNVTLFPVESASRLEQLIQEGIGRRQVDGTEMNAASSRSHMLLSIVIKTYNNLTKRTHTGKLSFVDLAGSESLKASGAQGKLVTETTHINSGLSFLNLVILALKNGYSHIPYGNDNLTRVLADSLGGNSKTLMIVNISPSNKYLEETEKSLSYGVLAQCIINTASRNVGATKK